MPVNWPCVLLNISESYRNDKCIKWLYTIIILTIRISTDDIRLENIPSSLECSLIHRD